MIVLFTDFGVNGPYVGQMKAVLYREAPGVSVIDLFADAPAFDPRLSAYLLAAYVNEFPEGSVFLCVVDPGVGDVARRPVIVSADGKWFVGPDNGLFNVVSLRAANPQSVKWWQITWQPENLSNSFHGRDLFAPVAAQLARGNMPECHELDVHKCVDASWPQELNKIVYIDAFGNAMAGVRAATVNKNAKIRLNNQSLQWARTFSEVSVGSGFWYENANGLLEISVNRGRADKLFDLHVGEKINIQNS